MPEIQRKWSSCLTLWYKPEIVVKAILYDFINRLFQIFTAHGQFSIRRFERPSICTSCEAFIWPHTAKQSFCLIRTCTHFLQEASRLKWDKWIKQSTLDLSRQITVLQCVTQCSLVVRYWRVARPCCHYIYTLKTEVLNSLETLAPLPYRSALPRITEIWNQ